MEHPQAIIGALGLTSNLPIRVVSSGVQRMNRISFELITYLDNFSHTLKLKIHSTFEVV